MLLQHALYFKSGDTLLCESRADTSSSPAKLKRHGPPKSPSRGPAPSPGRPRSPGPPGGRSRRAARRAAAAGSAGAGRASAARRRSGRRCPGTRLPGRSRPRRGCPARSRPSAASSRQSWERAPTAAPPQRPTFKRRSRRAASRERRSRRAARPPAAEEGATPRLVGAAGGGASAKPRPMGVTTATGPTPPRPSPSPIPARGRPAEAVPGAAAASRRAVPGEPQDAAALASAPLPAALAAPVPCGGAALAPPRGGGGGRREGSAVFGNIAPAAPLGAASSTRRVEGGTARGAAPRLLHRNRGHSYGGCELYTNNEPASPSPGDAAGKEKAQWPWNWRLGRHLERGCGPQLEHLLLFPPLPRWSLMCPLGSLCIWMLPLRSHKIPPVPKSFESVPVSRSQSGWSLGVNN